MLNWLKWVAGHTSNDNSTAQKAQSVLFGYSRSDGNISFNGLTRQDT